jgi:hypothetical protein
MPRLTYTWTGDDAGDDVSGKGQEQEPSAWPPHRRADQRDGACDGSDREHGHRLAGGRPRHTEAAADRRQNPRRHRFEHDRDEAAGREGEQAGEEKTARPDGGPDRNLCVLYLPHKPYGAWLT